MEILWNVIVSEPKFCTETMRKLCLSTKFPHQEIRWNQGIFRSVRRSEDVLDVFWTSYLRTIYFLCLRGTFICLLQFVLYTRPKPNKWLTSITLHRSLLHDQGSWMVLLINSKTTLVASIIQQKAALQL